MTKWVYASWGFASNKPQYVAKIRIDSKVSPAFDAQPIGVVKSHAQFRLIKGRTVQSKIGSRRRFLKVLLWKRDLKGNWEREYDLSKAFTQNYQSMPFMTYQLSENDFTADKSAMRLMSEMEMHWIELGLGQFYNEIEDPSSSLNTDFESHTQRYMAEIHERYGQISQHMHSPASQHRDSFYRNTNPALQQSGPQFSDRGWEWRGNYTAQPQRIVPPAQPQRIVPHQMQARCPDCGEDPSTFTETGANSNYYLCNSCNQRHYVDSLLSSS